MNIIQLKCFVAVAEELNFSRAAEKLFMSQPPISRNIKKLEENMGTKLFIRNKHEVFLTEEGDFFYSKVVKILNQLEKAVQETSMNYIGKEGILKITFPSHFINSSSIISSFCKDHPESVLEVSEITGGKHIINGLKKHHADVVFYYGKEQHKDIETHILMEDEILFAIPKTHPLGNKKEISVSMLKDQPIVIFPRKVDPFWYDFFMQQCYFNGFSPNTVLFSSPQRARLSFVNAGIGLTLINEGMIDHSLKNINYCKLVKEEKVNQSFIMAWRKNEKNKNVEKFVNSVKALSKKYLKL